MSDLILALPATGWVLMILGAVVTGISKSMLPGSATIAVALFALALPAKESTAAALLLFIVGDAAAITMYRREADVRVLVRLIPSVLIGLVIGATFLVLVGGDAVRRTIGVILIVLVAVTLWRRHRAGRAERAAAESGPGADEGSEHRGSGAAGGAEASAGTSLLARVVYGTLGGFTTMVANSGGPVMSMYFYAMRMPVVAFLGTTAWFFAVVNILKLPFSIGIGLFSPQLVMTGLLLAPLVIATAWVGRRLAPRIPQGLFENAVLVLTVLSAAALLV